MISDLSEPHAYTSLLQFCSRAFIPPHSDHPLSIPNKKNHLSSHLCKTLPLPSLELVPNLAFSLILEPLSLFFFSISTLPLFFHTPSLPFLVLPYYHLLGAPYFLLGTLPL